MQILNQLKQPGYLRSLVAMLGGAVLGVVAILCVHLFQSHLSVMERGPQPWNGPPASLVLRYIEKVYLTMGGLPYIALIFLYIGYRAVRLRNHEEGWKAAFFVGFILIFVLRQIAQKL